MNFILTLALRLCLVSLAISPVRAAIPITGPSGGVNTATGERPVRQNLENFQTSGAAFDLYILALQMFQQEDQSNLLSYYQVAGIHGYPYKPWDGVDGVQDSGYCNHDSELFLPWHRPYLALFEQTLYDNVQKIANAFPESARQQYVSAATSWRIPYWDWAEKPQIPQSLTAPFITINTPTGSQSLKNPLYQYDFHPFPLGTDIPTNGPLTQYNHTVRSPTASGDSDNAQVQAIINANFGHLRSDVYQLLSTEHNYTVFSNDALTDRGANYNNLESIHNAIHSFTGNGGHMTYVMYSAWDPIFWLHHANVDRLFAMWQALNPSDYVGPYNNEHGTYTEPPNTLEDVNSGLTPFHASASDNDFWSSATARTTRTFGYTYPELTDWNVSPQDLAANVRTAVNRLYNPSTSLTKRSTSTRISPRQPTGEDQEGEECGCEEEQPSTGIEINLDICPVTLDILNLLGVNNLDRHWVANVRVNKFALETSFYVHFFIGAPPADESTWSHAPNLAGTYAVFSGKPAMPMSRTTYGQVALSHVLALAQDQGRIPDLHEDAVVPFLRDGLQWRVQDAAGHVVDAQQLADQGGLNVLVASREVTPLRDGEDSLFPGYGDWTTHPEATVAKAGGA